MSNFCIQCGFPLGASNTFCPKCGTRHSAAAPATPAASSNGLKIVLVVVGCLGLAGVAAVAGLYYIGHRVKQAVIERAAENGVDLKSIPSPAAHSNTAHVKAGKQCDWISTNEISSIIGEPIERAEAKDEMCAYYGPPGLAGKLAEKRTADTMKRIQQPDPHFDSGGLEALGPMGGDDAPLLMLAIEPDGRPQFTAIMASHAMFSGIFKAAEAKGASFGGVIPDLGDKAVRLPQLGINVLKGDAFIRVIPGPIPEGNAKAIVVARALLKLI